MAASPLAVSDFGQGARRAPSKGAFDNHPAGVTFSRTFFRVAAVCSFLSAITTLGLIFLPRLYQPVASFDERMALFDNAAYLTRSWVCLLYTSDAADERSSVDL